MYSLHLLFNHSMGEIFPMKVLHIDSLLFRLRKICFFIFSKVDVVSSLFHVFLVSECFLQYVCTFKIKSRKLSTITLTNCLPFGIRFFQHL